MKHLFKYAWISTIREYTLIFWALAFPLILATLFYFTFGSHDGSESFEPVKVAVVIEQENDNFQQVIDELEGKWLIVTYEDIETAHAQLFDDKISGIYRVSDTISLEVAFNSIDATILQSIMDKYTQNNQLIADVAQNHPQKLATMLESEFGNTEHVRETTISGGQVSGNNQYFYALIAMASLYGNFMGLMTILKIQANYLPLAARRTIAPIRKLKLLFCEISVDILIQFFNMIILISYIRYILAISLGNQTGYLLLLCFVGSIAGVVLGMFIGSLTKLGKNMKFALCVVGTLLCSFLAGLMYGRMKIIVEHYAPAINKINPAALIADACYALTVGNQMKRYSIDLGILLFESAILFGFAIWKIRGERYDSI